MLYNTPVDKKAPRYRKPVKNILNQEFYRKLKKGVPGSPFSNMEVKKIVTTFNQLCVDTIATKRDGLELPQGLGYIILASFQTPNSELFSGLKNWNTNRKSCKIYYTNVPSKYKFKFANLWGFQPGRQMKKAVSQSFLKNHAIFHKIDSIIKVARLFGNKRKDVLLKRLKRIENKNKSNPE